MGGTAVIARARPHSVVGYKFSLLRLFGQARPGPHTDYMDRDANLNPPHSISTMDRDASHSGHSGTKAQQQHSQSVSS